MLTKLLSTLYSALVRTYVLIFMHACSLLSSQELEPPVATLKGNLQKLEVGRYWDMDRIKPK